nr:MAG TPA: hypothetical protein [Bacteriophage sp.]
MTHLIILNHGINPLMDNYSQKKRVIVLMLNFKNSNSILMVNSLLLTIL